MLKTFKAITSILISYSILSLSHAQSQEKCREIPSHLKTFNHSQQIRNFENALENAEFYIKKIGYVGDFQNYGSENYYASFKIIHERMKDDCDGDAVAAMALLHKYNPRMLIISDKASFIPFRECYFDSAEIPNSHAICIVQKDGKYYSPGISNNQGLNSLKELAYSMDFGEKINWKYYWICDFSLDDLLNSEDNILNNMKIVEQGKLE